ncbi:MAG: hypothetical protein ABIL09_23445 [Gemmatimonadota bacterium]
MRIRKFVASSMPLALQQVRETLGEDAVILNTRKLSGRGRLEPGQVEVTAGCEEEVPAMAAATGIEARPGSVGAPRPVPLYSRLYNQGRGGDARVRALDLASVVPNLRPAVQQPAPEKPALPPERPALSEPPAQPALGAPLQQLKEAIARMERLATGLALPPALDELAGDLRRAGVAEELVRQCLQAVFQELDGSALAKVAVVRRRAAEYLAGRLPPRRDIRIGKGRRTVAFVGLSGSGKTTAMAKIAAGFAAKLRRRGESREVILIVSTDTRRVGGLDQVRSLAELVGVPFEVAYEEAEMVAALERHPAARLVLIDTAGCGLREAGERERQQRLLEVAETDEVHIVVDGLTSLENTVDIVQAHPAAPERRLLFTKMDEATRPGSVLSAAVRVDVPVSYLTDGPALPGGLRPGDLRALVDEVVSPASAIASGDPGARPSPGREGRAGGPWARGAD